MGLLFGVFFTILIGFFWLGISLSVKLDGWKRGVAFTMTVSGLIFLSASGFFHRVVEACMTPWMKP